MIKMTTKNIYCAILISCVFPLSAYAQNATTTNPLSTAFANKACQTRYQNEVSAVLRLVDRTKAQKKVEEIRTQRREQDQNIKVIFEKIANKIEETDKKELISEHKEEVLKTIDERRSKIDELQENIQITRSDVDALVRATLTTYLDEENPRVCPITPTNAREIRRINTVELRKLAEAKSLEYQKQTREIQQVFLTEVRSTLSELSDELKK
jgi:hypothetical protein